MSYRESLKALTEATDGSMAAIIMGYDGIPIDEFIIDNVPYDMQLVAVEYANLLRDIKRTVELLENGAMQEISIATDRLRVLVRVINDDFFLVMIIATDGNYGKGRYLLSREAIRLREELG